jgi:hypothetical protein
LVCLPYRWVKGCGGWYDEPTEYYYFNQAPFFTNKEFSEYLFSPINLFYCNKEVKNMNVDSWKKYFQDVPEEYDIDEFVYKYTYDQVAKVKYVILQKSRYFPGDPELRNTLVNYVVKTRNIPFVEYMLWAKRNESVYNNGPYKWYWSDRKEPDTSEILTLMAGNENMINNTGDNFLKRRYAFQAIKLAHLAKKYELCIQLYDKYFAESKTNDYIKYRAMMHKAGSLITLGKKARGTYLFMMVFDKLPDQRDIAYQNYEIENEEDFNTCLGYCKTDHEKAMLYVLRGIQPYALTLESMRAIYKLDPKSEFLNLLLVREVAQLEANFMSSNTNSAKDIKFDDYTPVRSIDYFYEVRRFIDSCITDNKVVTPYAWLIAGGYLAMYDHDPKAHDYVSKLKNMELTSDAANALTALELAVAVNELNKVDEKKINQLYLKYKNTGYFRPSGDNEYWSGPPSYLIGNEYYDFFSGTRSYLIDKVAYLYRQKGDTALAEIYLRNYTAWDFHDKSRKQLYYVQRVLDFIDKKNKTEFETFMCPGDSRSKAIFLEYKGTILLGQNRLEEAIKTFRQINSAEFENSYVFYINRDPFEETMVSWPACKDSLGWGRADWPKVMSKLEYAEKLLNLEKIAKGSGEEAAKANFLLGNAYYNTTYFGKAWMALTYYRSNSYYGDDFPYSNCSHALEHFDKAMKMTRLREFAAKCCFMAAKCEQNQYTLEGDIYWKRIIWNDKRTYFATLHDNYSNTKYYQECIRECSYFRYYVNSF